MLLNNSGQRVIFLVTIVLLVMVLVVMNTIEVANKSNIISVTRDSVIEIRLPSNVNQVEPNVSSSDWINKGDLIARVKDNSGRLLAEVTAKEYGYFVKSPSCCDSEQNVFFGYLVKKNNDKVVFFQSKDLKNYTFRPGDKVLIESTNLTQEGEVIMTMGGGANSMKIVYGVNFDKQPNYQSLLYEEPLTIRKISPVKRLVKRTLKEVFMIRL